MAGYTSIDVVETAVLCGLDIKQSTLQNIEVQARCPYCNDYKYRMYLCHDPENPTWFCHNYMIIFKKKKIIVKIKTTYTKDN